ncbi:hypothetical protein [Streptomyces sp. NPDC047097]|uniref:hypothetical protein n=1 Tax=Streptomyces sp. NPDC047097 TaxID=3155260 RepID=UPI0033C8894D
MITEVWTFATGTGTSGPGHAGRTDGRNTMRERCAIDRGRCGCTLVAGDLDVRFIDLVESHYSVQEERALRRSTGLNRPVARWTPHDGRPAL